MVEDVSVIGDEAFINPTESKELTLGYYLSKDLDLFHVDFGLGMIKFPEMASISHHETTKTREELEEDHEEELEFFDRDINTTSYSLTLSRDITEFLEVSLGFPPSNERLQR